MIEWFLKLIGLRKEITEDDIRYLEAVALNPFHNLPLEKLKKFRSMGLVEQHVYPGFSYGQSFVKNRLTPAGYSALDRFAIGY